MNTIIQTITDYLIHLGVNQERASIIQAPGRIDVLGGHTEYNGGLVLAATIERYVWVAGVLSDTASIHSILFNDTVNFDPHSLTRSQTTNWYDYIKGVMWAFQRRKQQVSGLTAVLDGNIPLDGGLGSSAALEVAIVNLIAKLNDLKIPPKALAMIAFEAERLFCGTTCSIVDQFVSQLSKPNSLLAVHCATMQTGNVPIDNSISILIVNLRIKKTAGVRLERQEECRQALIQLQREGWDISAISQIKKDDLGQVERILDATLADRVKHIVLENERVRRGIQTLREGDVHEFGTLMYESHESLRNLYDISYAQSDSIVDTASHQKGVIGARLAGTGAGETVLCLVKDIQLKAVAETIIANYGDTGHIATWFSTKVPGGVVVL